MASNTKKAAVLAQQGASFHPAGRIDLAEDCYRRSLALDRKTIDALHLPVLAAAPQWLTRAARSA